MPTVKPYGSWPSPITARLVSSQGLRLSQGLVDGPDVYWVEGRPEEGGCNVLVRRTASGLVHDVSPAGFNVRSRVHEYGGGACLVSQGVAYVSNFVDQRLYRIDLAEADGHPGVPVPVTAPGDCYFADATIDHQRRRLIAVREDHADPGREAVNTLVSMRLDGEPTAGEVIASGGDFYSTPRLSPDGSRLAWLMWRHPQMPWDGTELWVATVAATGALVEPRRVAGGPSESIYQPGWLPDGTLIYASDRDGWWTLYRADGSTLVSDPPAQAEFGRPQWVFGSAVWASAGPTRLVVSYTQRGRWHLATLDLGSGRLSTLAAGLEPREWLTATPTHALLVGGSATTPDAVLRVDLDSGHVDTIRLAAAMDWSSGYVSVPESIEFPSIGGRITHAFYYPPTSAECRGPANEAPPLVVIGHGGPTDAARAMLDLKVQFWTSRGFAVVDVNYGGSSGFGRLYRQRLNGQWGVVDVDDMVAAARFLVERGRADPHRLVIRGGSAGGYTTLAALTFRPGVFTAGASYYGICDIEVLARDTHKFESRYLEGLIGPYPASRELYRARSPIHFVDRVASSLILFQGLEDKIVPPNQSEMMAAAVRAKGLRVAYLAFEGEQHGFRRAATIVRSLEAELYFYGVVFGFVPADRIEPIPIDNQ